MSAPKSPSAQKVAHTPTPWKFHYLDEIAGTFEIRSENDRVFICQGDLMSPPTVPTAVANARYILRAVNSHEALLEACKAALVHLGHTTFTFNQVAAAISLAEKPR